MNKILVRITMSAAGTLAPYNAVAVYLTTWDSVLTIDGHIYEPGFIKDIEPFEGEQTFASGEGGYFTGLSSRLVLLNATADGTRLLPLVHSGAVPLDGARFEFLDEAGAVVSDSWYLQQGRLSDVGCVAFELVTKEAADTKKLSWEA